VSAFKNTQRKRRGLGLKSLSKKALALSNTTRRIFSGGNNTVSSYCPLLLNNAQHRASDSDESHRIWAGLQPNETNKKTQTHL
jgi:hypothetical protein